MQKNFKIIFRIPLLWGAFALILMLIFSLSLRKQDFKKVTGSQNLEATYHVLLTVAALNENPVTNHLYLPIVSLGREADKQIPWGATVPTKNGDYIYTSFTPLGFLAPYFWFKIFGLEVSVYGLAIFNFFLGSVSAFVLFFLLVSLLKFNGYGPHEAVLSALIGVSVGIFSREAMLSHGLIYWHQSLYQVILISSICLIFKWLTSKDEKTRQFYLLTIIVATFVGPLIEWSGYIFNGGLVFLLWFNKQNLVYAKALAINILFVTIIAAIMTVAHFSLAIGFGPAIEAFFRRFLARNTSTGSVVGLIQGYGLSYGLFILVIFLILMLTYFSNREKVTRSSQPIMFFVFVVACMPLFENILMLQHAMQFSYDRLKFIFPAALILAFSFARLEVKGRIILLALVFVSGFHGYRSYKEDMSLYSSWASIDDNNKRLMSNIKNNVDIECAVFSSDFNVRGYQNLLFHRGIYENKSFQDAQDFLINRNACASVYLEAEWAFCDLHKYTKATVIHDDGSMLVVMNDGQVLQMSGEVDDSFFLTDDNWFRGIARNWAGFFVPNNRKFWDKYKIGKFVKLANGENHKITHVIPNGKYLNIFLDIKINSPEKAGLPSKFVVIDK